MVTSTNGVLAALDWNSNKWQEPSTEEDLEHSSFPFLVEHKFTYAALNFAHEHYPADDKGYYYGVLPQFTAKPPDRYKLRDVKIVFLKSRNWNDGDTYLIGFYAFPVFDKGTIPSPLEYHDFEVEHNIKSLSKDILLLDQPVNLSLHPKLKSFLPKGKDLAKQSVHYLTKENVLKILDECSIFNPDNSKLKNIKLRMMRALGLTVL